jgi:DNA-binding SARP family transcriptional activator
MFASTVAGAANGPLMQSVTVSPMTHVEVRLLGPVEALRAGDPVRLGGSKQRAALAVLGLNPGRIVSTDRLIEALWGDRAPATAVTALHGHISRLRRLLGPDAIVTSPPGYVLDGDTVATDLARFDELVAAVEADDPLARAERLRRALGLWRGAALADLVSDCDLALAEKAHRLDELRLDTQEELFDVRLQLGEHVEVVPALETFVREQPLRERPVAQLMLALYRSGRQADSLATYRRLRQRLREELGLEPGLALRELERRVLEHDPGLAPSLDTPLEVRLEQRRIPVSVLAVGIAAATVADEPDPEAYEHVVSQAREAVRLCLERHGASVQRLVGVGLLGLFGIPAPHDDDASRALRAAREAIDSVEAVSAAASKRFGLGLSVQAGIASGEAFAGETPAVERALRLQGEAAHGEVVADDATRARGREREPRLDHPLAGRDSERNLLREVHQRVLSERRSALVVLSGPAGIGKSRLAADFLDTLDPATRVLYARCLSYGDGVSLIPAIDLVRAGTGLSAQASEEEARERLASLLGEGERAASAVEQLVRTIGLGDEPPGDEEGAWAVHRLLERLARRSPVVVMVDDLQWGSSALLDLVEHLAEPVDAPLLILATAREARRERLRDASIEVGPIDTEACAEVVAALLDDGEIEPGALSSLVDYSGGNPLFFEELVLDLRESGRLHRSEGRWQLGTDDLSAPRSLESLLAARLDRLPAREREVLRSASVIGHSFALRQLRGLVDGPLDEPVESLEEEGLIRPSRFEEADFDFHHLLIRDAAYASLSLEDRADLHQRHAEWIEQSSISAPLEREALAVYHLNQSHRALAGLAPGDDRVVAGAAPLAARTATLGRALLGRGDAAAAAALLERALELGAVDAQVTVDLGRAHFDGGDFPAAERAFAAAAAGPAAHRARLGLLDVALRTDPRVDLDAAEVEISAARLTLEREQDTQGVAEAWLAAAYLALLRGSAAELARNLEPALDYARRSGRPRAETWILFLVCAVCWYGPLPVEEGIRRCEGVLADARGRPNVEAAAMQSLAVLRAMNGEVEDARRLVSASRRIRRELGQLVGAAASAIDEGLVLLLAGDDEAAELTLREGYEELEQLGEKGYLSTVAALLAEAIIGQGRTDEAREFALAAAEAASEDDVVSQVGWRTIEARALAACGEHDDANRVAREAARRADETDFLLLRAEAWAAVADVCAAAGNRSNSDDARARASSLLESKGCAGSAVEALTHPRLHTREPRGPS